MSLRFDSTPIANVQRTPQGGIRVLANVARTGIQVYTQPDGTRRREYRPPSEVFAPEALASLAGAPVTYLHPKSGRVDSADWRNVAVGHVGEDGRQDGAHVAATLFVQDAETIDRVASEHLREVSLGYDTIYRPEPGVTPEGEPYDGIQTQIRINHAALVPLGRAGHSVGLRLDAADNQIEDSPDMTKIKIAGKEYVAGSPEADAALRALEAKSARVDALEAEQVKVRIATRISEAAAVGVTVRADAASESDVMLQVLAKLVPGLSVEGQSPEFIMGAFLSAMTLKLEGDVAPEPEPEPVDGPDAPPAVDPPAPGGASVRADALAFRPAIKPKAAPAKRTDAAPAIGPAEAARLKMIERAHAAAQR